ncbi:MAG TPA: FHA domain-containing protein, partial [Tepidisphaeraceae bacterium]|nr:FHA domain-containing protein [Tepidisphaeraceae bacterium]
MAVEQPSSKKSPPLPWPALIPLGHHTGKPPISLAKTVMLVGSRSNAHLHLLSRHVSKAHALILSNQGRVYIRDLASREKVYVNGREVREAWLKDRDLLKIGSFTFKYKDGPKKGPEERDAGHDADLVVDGADAPLAVAEKVMLIGRRPTCDVSLMEVSVSTAHAVIFGIAGKRYVRDLGSRTGTFVNGQKVHQHELNFGDVVRIGETDLRFEPAGEGAIRPATDDEFDLGGVAVGAGAAAAVAADEFVVEDELPAADVEPVEQEATYDADLIPVHSDEPTVTPAAPVAAPPRSPSRGASREELDELENLVGTAPLDVAAEIAREGRGRVPVPEELAPPARPADDED